MIRAACALVLLAGLAWGQESQQVLLSADRTTPQSKRVRADVLFVPAGRRPGGYGWTEVRLDNPSDAPHTVALRQESMDFGRTGSSFVRRIALEPGASARVILPLPASHGAQLRMTVDGARDTASVLSGSAEIGVLGMSMLEIKRPTARENWARDVELLVQSEISQSRSTHVYGTPDVEAMDLVPAQLPDRWWLLTGFDLILIDGRTPGLDAATQKLLHQAIRGGVHVLVLHADQLPEGALRALRTPDRHDGRLGFGGWHLSNEGRIGLNERRWLTGNGVRKDCPVRRTRQTLAGPPPIRIQFPRVIPGLGEVPVRLFFLLILGFAVLVGPINHFYFKRRRKMLWMLVTIPAIGLGFTGLILLYGLFSEGFGVKGVRVSLTYLDQRSHEAATYTGRTLYAGLSPAALQVAGDPYLYSVHLVDSSLYPSYGGWGDPDRPANVHRLDMNLDRGGEIGGGLLPSRTVTSITTLRQGPARERIRLRRVDGGFEVLAAPEFRPVERAASVLYRDFDGAYYLSDRSGRLLRTARGDKVHSVHKKVWKPMMMAAYPGQETGPFDSISSTRKLNEWMNDLGNTLEPGCYLAHVEAVPSDTGLGLETEYIRSAAIVHGRLAKEDIVE